MSKVAGIKHELQVAAGEQSSATARIDKLRATAFGTGDLQTRMVAAFQLDAIEFKRRSRIRDLTDDMPERIMKAKHKAEAQRLARVRHHRIAAGLPVRKPRAGKPVGTMQVGECADSFAAADGRCAVCGRPHERIRSKTCSPRCGRALRAARKASFRHVNLVMGGKSSLG